MSGHISVWDRIQDNYATLAIHMETTPLTDNLFQRRVICREDIWAINVEKTQDGKNRLLLNIIQSKTDAQQVIFVDVLAMRQSHLANLIRNTDKKPSQVERAGTSDSLPRQTASDKGTSKSNMSEAILKDLAAGTRFKLREVQDMYKKFGEDYPRGVITEAEYVKRNCGSICTDKTAAEGLAECKFRAYDADGNGEVDFEEYVHARSCFLRGSIPEKLEFGFRGFDKNKDGRVSYGEAKEVIANIYSAKGKKDCDEKARNVVDEIFKHAGKKNDLTLTLEEFVKAAEISREIRDLLIIM